MQPLSAFNFAVRLLLDGEQRPICDGAFSEVTGLEASIDTQTIREGGNNTRQIHLMGQISYGQATLKRGLTKGLDLWTWFNAVNERRDLRASGEIVLLSGDRESETIKFILTGCLPMKLKMPSLNATDGIVAIEEMQIAYETLDVRAA
ncbi:MAG: phage tail protein [Pseudomonadota bacterium]